MLQLLSEFNLLRLLSDDSLDAELLPYGRLNVNIKTTALCKYVKPCLVRWYFSTQLPKFVALIFTWITFFFSVALFEISFKIMCGMCCWERFCVYSCINHSWWCVLGRQLGIYHWGLCPSTNPLPHPHLPRLFSPQPKYLVGLRHIHLPPEWLLTY